MEEVLKMHFSVATVPFDTIMHSNTTPMNFLSSRSFGDLAKRSLVSCLSTFITDLR